MPKFIPKPGEYFIQSGRVCYFHNTESIPSGSVFGETCSWYISGKDKDTGGRIYDPLFKHCGPLTLRNLLEETNWARRVHNTNQLFIKDFNFYKGALKQLALT